MDRLRGFVGEWFTNSDLLLAGGWIIGLILLLTFVMWLLILQRYLVLRFDVGDLLRNAHETWRAGRTSEQHVNRRLRAAITHGFRNRLIGSLASIQVLTAVLPLLGLLGTVAGMIETFTVMTVFGSGNVRGMAGGISQALITTMAGLITALTGVYFANDLEQRIEVHTNHLSEYLVDGEIET